MPLSRHKEILLNNEKITLSEQSGLGEIDTLIKSINKLCSYVVDVKSSDDNEEKEREKIQVLKDKFMADYSLLLSNKEKNLARSLVVKVSDELNDLLSDCSINLNEMKVLFSKIDESKEESGQVEVLFKELKVSADKINQVVTTSSAFSEKIRGIFGKITEGENIFFYKNDLYDVFKEVSSFFKKNHLVIEEDIIFSADPLVVKRLLWVVFFLIYQVDEPSSLKTSVYKKNMNIYIMVSYALSSIKEKSDDSSVVNKLAFELYIIELFVQNELKGSFSYDVDEDLGAEWVISFPSLI